MLSEFDIVMPRQVLRAFDQLVMTLGLESQAPAYVSAAHGQEVLRYRLERAGFAAFHRVNPENGGIRKDC
jgi:hypothetical protein